MRWIIFAAVFFLFFSPVLHSSEVEPEGPGVLHIFWTDSPPVIDGKMDDPSWEKARKASDFTLFKKAGKPTRQTEVYALYNHEYLFLFWKLYEQEMGKLVYGMPEDIRDIISWQDTAELFLDPDCTRENYYQFATTPSTARYDRSDKKGTAYNANWKVRSGIYDWGWTLEMAIPFTGLAHSNEYYATPQPGDKWGINFCRDQASLHEWSQWVPSMMSFHEVKFFGAAYFMGREKGQNLPLVEFSFKEPLFFGPAEYRFIIKDVEKDGKISSVYYLWHKDRLIEKKPLAQKEDNAFVLTSSISSGDLWRLGVVFLKDKKPFYQGEIWNILPPVREVLEEIDKKLKPQMTKMSRFKHPVTKELNKKARMLIEKTSAARTKLREPSRLTRADWQALYQDVEKIKDEWNLFQYDMNLMMLYPEGRKRVRPFPFAVGTARSDEKVYPETLYKGSLSDPIEFSMAGNEYESVQMVLIPFWEDSSDVRVTFSDLSGKGGEISRSNFSTYQVQYVEIENFDPDDPSFKRYEPDILFPAKSFNIQQGKLSIVWVDFYLPAGTPKGIYEGTVTISNSADSWTRKIKVNSYGFDLPKTGSLENNFWFNVDNWRRIFYGALDYTPEMFERHARTLSRYRVTSIPVDWVTLWKHITIYHEPDGSFSFDLSVLDRFIDIGLRYGSNSYWSSLTCNLAGLTPFVSRHREVVDIKTGKKVNLGEYIKDWLNKKEYYDKNPVYRDFLTQYSDYLKKRGINDISYWEIYDEPNDNSRWLDMIRHTTFLKKHVPDLKIKNFGVDPTVVRAGKSAVGLIDVWSPHLDGAYDKEVRQAILKRREEFGEKFWFYTCGERTDGKGGYSPYIRYNRPYIAGRIHSWMAWDLQADGMLIYALSAVPQSNKVETPEKRWPNTIWKDGNYRGCGTLVYPGPDYEMISGMRLANIRDGLEDYEYFYILSKWSKRLDRDKDAKLMERINSALSISPELIDGIYSWTKDIKQLEKRREILAGLIKEVELKTTD
jgi:hypothetical protein